MASDEVANKQAIFYGVVHPLGHGWSFEQKIEFRYPWGNCELFIQDGKFTVLAFGDIPSDGETFQHQLKEVIQGCLDAFGFHVGCDLTPELYGGFVSPNRIVFSNMHRWPEAAGLAADAPVQVSGEILVPFTTAAIDQPLVRHALGDISAAISSANDTAFHCYRAIESVRTWFQEQKPETDDEKVGWERLRSQLNFKENELKQLRDLAKRRRHGGAAEEITVAQRLWCIDLARRLVDAFVKHLKPATA